MRTRKLGITDLELSTVGLGTWPMGADFGAMSWGHQDDEVSVNTILHALDQGINWLDTASAYGRGHAEEVVGMASKKWSKPPIIVAKCGSNPEYPLEADSIPEQCEASLKRMGVEVIDLFLVHWPRPIENLESGWQACADLVKAGKVRYIGVSNFTIEQMEKIQGIHPIAAMEPPYSMINRGIEDAILDYCRYRNMGVVVYSPLQQGVLTDTPLTVDDLEEGDFRLNNPNFKEPVLGLNRSLVEGLKPIAKKYSASVAQLAIAWVLRRPEVTSALNGARKPNEIEDSVKGGDLELSQEDIGAIEKLLEKRRRAMPPPPPRSGPPGGGPPGGGRPGGGPPGTPPARP